MGLPSVCRRIPVDGNGTMSMPGFSGGLEKAEAKGSRKVFVLATIGTTMEGAADDVDEIINRRLKKEGFGREDWYIYIDAAPSGPIYRDCKTAPEYMQGPFTAESNLVSYSLHKNLGMKIGAILIHLASDSDQFSALADYIRGSDGTLFCTRSGHLAMEAFAISLKLVYEPA